MSDRDSTIGAPDGTIDAQDATIAQVFPRATAFGRRGAGVIVGGVIAAVVWMFVMQEGYVGRVFGHKWTEHDFPDGLGNAFGAKDTAHSGLYLTLALGVIVAIIFALVESKLPGRGLVKGVWYAVPIFLAWGLLFTPLIDSREVLRDDEFVFLPTGFFGVDAGWRTVISGVVASLMAGILIARITQLMRDAKWWSPHPEIGTGLSKAIGVGLLELPEEGPEKSGERPR
jgi:hypothetical protein